MRVNGRARRIREGFRSLFFYRRFRCLRFRGTPCRARRSGPVFSITDSANSRLKSPLGRLSTTSTLACSRSIPLRARCRPDGAASAGSFARKTARRSCEAIRIRRELPESGRRFADQGYGYGFALVGHGMCLMLYPFIIADDAKASEKRVTPKCS